MTPTPDENRFALDGVAYVAVALSDDEGLSCETCAFRPRIEACMDESRPRCTGDVRKDRRNIVWKREAGK